MTSLHRHRHIASLASLARTASDATGFRGINGLRPTAGRPRVPSIYSTIPLPQTQTSLSGSHGDVPDVEEFPMATLYVREASGYREACAQDVINCAQNLIARRYRAGTPVMDAPARTRQYLKLHLGGLDYEVFGCLFLDNRHRLIVAMDIFRGTIDGASVHPREVVKAAIVNNAAACILFHNHPSGVSEPSTTDETITRRLKEALQLVDVRLLDHFIVGQEVYSFAESGRL
jgi:DNA repair protein RadC